jgi:hypothetical protein
MSVACSGFRLCRPLHWCALISSLAVARLEAIVISEVHYQPDVVEDPGETLEFVEIYNDSPVVYDLSGAYFSRGIEFTFPEGTFLPARSHLAVAANLELLRRRYGDVPAVGDFRGRLENRGETLRLVTATGSPLAEVRYRSSGDWPAAAAGAGYSLSLRDPFADPSRPESWSPSAFPGGTPGEDNFAPPAPIDNELFAELSPGIIWRYRKGWDAEQGVMAPFSEPPDAWRAPDFDDSGWPEGEAPIGFGESQVVTRLDDMQNNYLAFAARLRFRLEAEHLEVMDSLVLKVRLDDGCVIYLNGVEVARSGLPGDPGTAVPHDVRATSAREAFTGQVLVFVVPRERARAGENVLAVQVHNQSLTSNDAALALGVYYRTFTAGRRPPDPAVVFNEVIARGAAAERGIELFNRLATAADLGGYRLAADPALANAYRIPAGTRLGPRGFLAIPESALPFPLDALELALFLAPPEGREIAAAYAFPEALPEGAASRARLPDGTGPWYATVEPTPGSANRVPLERGIVINEIHYNPRLSAPDWKPLRDTRRGEFIELFNRSERSIDLSGYRLASAIQYSFVRGTMLAAGGYLVVARDPAFIMETYGLAPGLVVGPPPDATAEQIEAFGSLDNAGERIVLLDPLGNAVNQVEYRDGGEWPADADGRGSSLELIDPRQDNSSPHAWAASDESSRAPWVEIDYEAVYQASLVPGAMESELHLFLISAGECLIDGVSITSGDPPVEHIPNGDFEVDTRPWRLTGTHVRSHRTTDEARFGSASLRLVATGAGDNRINRIELDTSPPLRQGPIRVRLWARWLRGSNTLHISGHNNAYGRTVWLPVAEATGSPGRENGWLRRLREETGGRGNLGPVISEVRHEPAVPLPGAPILVRARISDADGVASAEAVYQRDGTAEFLRVPLRDDGQEGDREAGDGLYTGHLPGFALRTILNYYIEATDAAGQARRYPREAPEQLLTFIVDDRMESTLFRYRLVVNAANLSAPVTGLTRRLLHSDELVDGTFIFEESQVYYNVGLRYRGSPWNRPPDPKMFRVRFNGDQRFFEQRRINISRYGSAQNEGVSYQLLLKAGVPEAPVPYSPRYQYLTVKFNGQMHSGTAMAEIRPIDGNYTAFNWPADPDGEAWKMTGKLAFSDAGTMIGSPDWTQVRVYTTGPYPATHSKENYRFYFNPTLQEEQDDFEPLIRLLQVMDRVTTPDDRYDEEIERILNVDSSLRVFAVRSLLSDWDTVGIGNGQNAYFYYAPLEGRHYLVPWDMDHTFERTDVAMVPGNSSNGFGRLIGRPRFRRLYASIIKELLDSSWSEDYMRTWTTMVSEPAGPPRVAPGAGLVSFLRTRRATANSFVQAAANVPFALTTPSPSAVAGGSIELEGTGSVSIAHLLVLVNGEPREGVDVAWSTPPRQPAAVPTIWRLVASDLRPERNDVQVLALDRAGGFLGSVRAEVYDARGWEAPALTRVEPAAGPMEGGTLVALRGSGFRPYAAVEFGTERALETIYISSSELAARTPPAALEGEVDVAVANLDGQKAVAAGAFRYGGLAPSFIRGEADGVPGVSLSDAIAILLYLFRAGELSCLDAADVDDDGRITLTDPVRLLLHLFAGGPPPAPPYPKAGLDPTEDGLDCAAGVSG